MAETVQYDQEHVVSPEDIIAFKAYFEDLADRDGIISGIAVRVATNDIDELLKGTHTTHEEIAESLASNRGVDEPYNAFAAFIAVAAIRHEKVLRESLELPGADWQRSSNNTHKVENYITARDQLHEEPLRRRGGWPAR